MKVSGRLIVAGGVILSAAMWIAPCALAANDSMPQPNATNGPTTAKASAPLMKFKILNQSAQETTYAVIFGVGDEILGGLTQFAEEHHISAARITGVGAIRDAKLAWLNPQTKTYKSIPIDHQVEVLSLLGDIALYQGKPVVHAHMVVGFSDGTAHGGHLLQAHVWPTLEVIITSYPRQLLKKFDPQKGIAVIDPSIHQ